MEMPENVRRLLEMLHGGPEAEDAIAATAEEIKVVKNTIGFRRLEQIKLSMTMQLTELASTRVNDVKATEMKKWADSHNVDWSALQVAISQIVTEVINEEDKKLLAMLIADPKHLQFLGRVALFCFIYGYTYHEHNTTLVDDLLQHLAPKE